MHNQYLKNQKTQNPSTLRGQAAVQWFHLVCSTNTWLK